MDNYKTSYAFSCLILCYVIYTLVYYTSLLYIDMIRRGNLRTRSIKLLVLDEADEMLAKGITLVQ